MFEKYFKSLLIYPQQRHHLEINSKYNQLYMLVIGPQHTNISSFQQIQSQWLYQLEVYTYRIIYTMKTMNTLFLSIWTDITYMTEYYKHQKFIQHIYGSWNSEIKSAWFHKGSFSGHRLFVSSQTRNGWKLWRISLTEILFYSKRARSRPNYYPPISYLLTTLCCMLEFLLDEFWRDTNFETT